VIIQLSHIDMNATVTIIRMSLDTKMADLQEAKKKDKKDSKDGGQTSMVVDSTW
jgi:hypothetical protein